MTTTAAINRNDVRMFRANVSGDTPSSAVWTVPQGITKTSESVGSDYAQALIGPFSAAASPYSVSVVVTCSSGQKLYHAWTIYVS